MRLKPGNAQNQGRRKEQQDSFGFSEPNDAAFVRHSGLLCVLADGMGGLTAGRDAGQQAVAAFLRAYMAKPPRQPVPEALLQAVTAANSAVVTLAKREGGTGSTLAAFVIVGDRLHWLSVGDSRIYVVRGDDVLCVTQDHAFRQRLLDRVAEGSATLAEAGQHPEAAHLTSYLGRGEIEEVDRSLRPFSLEPGDIVVGCTDGVYRAVQAETFAKAFANGAQEGCEALLQRALERGDPKQDNATVVAIECEAEGARGSRRSKTFRPWLVAALAAQIALAVLLAIWGGSRVRDLLSSPRLPFGE